MVDRRQDMRNMDPPPPGSTERDREVIRLRNHYLGLSGASRMGFSAEAGDYYAAEVAHDGDVLAGDGALMDRVLSDLEAHSGNTSEKEIWLELRRLDGIATLRCGGDPQPLRRVA
jgi:hypothetical protein